MNTSDTTTGAQPNAGGPEQAFQHLKEDVTEALGGARQQADAQFGQYRDTAADQIDALAQGAKSVVSELENKDTLGMSDYLADMAESMSGLAGNLRGKSAEQLLHEGADLARNNPALFIAGSIALGFGLSRFLKAGSAPASTVSTRRDPAEGHSIPPSGGFGAQRPYETSVPPRTDSGFNEHEHPSDFATTPAPDSTSFKGAL